MPRPFCIGGRSGKRELFVGARTQTIETLTVSATNSVHEQLPPFSPALAPSNRNVLRLQ
jgi:hypothetical protein